MDASYLDKSFFSCINGALCVLIISTVNIADLRLYIPLMQIYVKHWISTFALLLGVNLWFAFLLCEVGELLLFFFF